MRSVTTLAFFAVGAVAAAVAVFTGTRDAQGSAPAPNPPLPGTEPAPPPLSNGSDLASLPSWPANSAGQAMTSEEQLALLQAAILLAGAPRFQPRRDAISTDAIDAWEGLLIAGLNSRPATIREDLQARAREYVLALRRARLGGSLEWSWADFVTLYLMIPANSRDRVDDDAEVILGRSL